jgi:hypothetical protein
MPMSENQEELDRLQADYRRAVDDSVAAIRAEEALAAVDHSVAKLDQWELAHDHDHEHKLHREVIYRKRLHEDALRKEFYGL